MKKIITFIILTLAFNSNLLAENKEIYSYEQIIKEKLIDDKIISKIGQKVDCGIGILEITDKPKEGTNIIKQIFSLVQNNPEHQDYFYWINKKSGYIFELYTEHSIVTKVIYPDNNSKFKTPFFIFTDSFGAEVGRCMIISNKLYLLLKLNESIRDGYRGKAMYTYTVFQIFEDGNIKILTRDNRKKLIANLGEKIFIENLLEE